MKEIFDWLRMEQENLKGKDEDCPATLTRNSSIDMCIEKIDEAQAKWEEDCCEWKLVGLETHTLHWETACRSYPRERDKKWKYCPFCSKRIKISEVE